MHFPNCTRAQGDPGLGFFTLLQLGASPYGCVPTVEINTDTETSLHTSMALGVPGSLQGCPKERDNGHTDKNPARGAKSQTLLAGFTPADKSLLLQGIIESFPGRPCSPSTAMEQTGTGLSRQDILQGTASAQHRTIEPCLWNHRYTTCPASSPPAFSYLLSAQHHGIRSASASISCLWESHQCCREQRRLCPAALPTLWMLQVLRAQGSCPRSSQC